MMRRSATSLAITIGWFAFGAACSNAAPIEFMAQHRVKQDDGTYRVEQTPTQWDPAQTAMVICDMWDKHWCEGATRRVGDMAPRMNQVVEAARERGVLIIHAPSSTIGFYEDTPARHRAKSAPHADMPEEDSWKSLDLDEEGPLPIDDSDGGCNCWPPCPDVNKSVWTRQIDLIRVDDRDAVSDSGQEVYNLLEAEGRDNVIVMGVHTNMCVLGRPFSIRAQVKNGKKVVLMRDLTDTMYNARMAPYVNHHRGTDLVVEHIEKYWAPSIVSSVFTSEAPHRFADDPRPHAVFLLHEDEYETNRTVPKFAEDALAGRFGWRCTYLFGNGLNSIPGLEVLDDADLLFVSVRRKVLPESAMAHVRAYCATGKPVVAIRTASHAFAPRDGEIPDGGDAWPEFDPVILGGNYQGHHGNKDDPDLTTVVWTIEAHRDHPILDGINKGEFTTTSWLYKVSPLAASATPLMMGRVADRLPHEPVAWTNVTKDGSRVFYTSLGHPDDFAKPDFRRLIVNGIVWAMKD